MGRSTTSQAEFPLRQFHHRIARDALQHVLRHRRRDQLALAHHEDVARRAFGHMAALVQEDGLVESAMPRFVAGQRAVHVRPADLGPRRNRIVLDPPPGAHAGMQSLVSVQIFAKRQRNHRKSILIVGAHAHPLRALVRQRPHIHIGREAHSSASARRVIAHNSSGDSGTSMRRMPQFCFQRS